MTNREHYAVLMSIVKNQGLMIECLANLIRSEEIHEYGKFVFDLADKCLKTEMMGTEDDSDSRSEKQADSQGLQGSTSADLQGTDNP